jgi:hypothetical protein
MKTCISCGKTKNLEFFVKQKRNKDGRAGKCKTCASLDKRVERQANPALPDEGMRFILKELLKGKYPVQIASESLGKFSGRQIAVVMRHHAKDEHYKALLDSPNKFCPCCCQILDKQEFSINIENLDGLQVYCAECRRETERKRYAKYGRLKGEVK